MRVRADHPSRSTPSSLGHCDALRAAVELTTVVVIVTGNASTTFFVCTSALFGAAAAFFSPASTGLVPQVVSAARLQEANALVSLSRSTVSVFGPAVSGLIVATAGAEWVFGVNGVSFLVSAFFLARLSVPERERAPGKAFFADLAEGWREVRSRSWLAAALIYFSIVNIGIASYFVLGPLIVEEELDGASSWAIAMTGGSIGGILGATIALRFKPAYPLRWSFGLIAFTAIQLLGLIPPLPAVGLAVLALFAVASIQVAVTFWNTTLQQRIPEHVLSRVVAYDWLVSLVFMPLGYVAAHRLQTRSESTPRSSASPHSTHQRASASCSFPACGTCAASTPAQHSTSAPNRWPGMGSTRRTLLEGHLA